MKMLISLSDLSSKKSRDKIPFECEFCGKTFFRSKNIVQSCLLGKRSISCCSWQCSANKKTKEAVLNCVCVGCGGNFTRVRSSVKKSERNFCSRKCSNQFNASCLSDETKTKIKNSVNIFYINNSRSLLLKKFNCPICSNVFHKTSSKQKTCSRKCSSILRWRNPVYRKNMTLQIKKRSSTIEARERLRDIGQKFGFGESGFTSSGTRYDSALEKKCFSMLEDLNIPFEAHKNIPNSSKVSDIYLPFLDLWIELDGMKRVKRRKHLREEDWNRWLEKMKLYKNTNLKFKVFLNFEDFEKFVNKNLIYFGHHMDST